MNKMLKHILISVTVVVGFFIVGFSFNDLRAAGLNPTAVKTALVSVPDRMEMLMDGATESGRELSVRQTYNETLNTIRDRFYPEASVLTTTVVSTPGNATAGALEKVEPSLDGRQLTYMALRGILSSLEDPFTGFMDPVDYKRMREENDGNFVGIGAQLWTNSQGQVYIKEPLPDCPAIEAGVKKGDIILKVDGKSIAGMDIEEVVKLIRGPENTDVTLSLSRGKDAELLDITINRRIVDYRMVEYEMLDQQSGIGWLQLRQFNSKADQQLDEALSKLESQQMRGLILDLRGNPGGLLEVARDIGSRFIERGPVVIIQERQGNRTPLEVIPSKHDHKMYPLVVLVDELSASASEIVAGAIKDYGAGTLIGTKTYGKGRVQTIVPLPGDAAVRITTAKYLTPKGTDINKVGILPDIVVNMPETPPEPEELEDADRLEHDPQLQKAVSFLKDKLGPRTTARAANR